MPQSLNDWPLAIKHQIDVVTLECMSKTLQKVHTAAGGVILEDRADGHNPRCLASVDRGKILMKPGEPVVHGPNCP